MKRTIAVIVLILSVTSIFAGQSEVEIKVNNSNYGSKQRQNISNKDSDDTETQYLGKKLFIISLSFEYSRFMANDNFTSSYSPGIRIDYYFSRIKSSFSLGVSAQISYSLLEAEEHITEKNYNSPQFLSIDLCYIMKFGITHCFLFKGGFSFAFKITGDHTFSLDSITYNYNSSRPGFLCETGYQFISATTNFSFFVLAVYRSNLSLTKSSDPSTDKPCFNLGITFGFGFNIL